MMALLAACRTDANKLVSIGDVSGDATSGDDTITLGVTGNAGTVDLGDGDDVVVGGALADLIRGGAGADNIKGGGGVDKIVLIGVTDDAGYTLSDLTNPNGTGIDLSSLIDIDDLNNNDISDVEPGEIIDGGADGAILFVYGNVDFTGVTLINITIIDVHSNVFISASTISTLIDGGTLTHFQGDGTTSITITNDGGAPIEVDLSSIIMQNIETLTLDAGVTLLADQADLVGVTTINGTGSIKAVTGYLDLDDIQVATDITILNSKGDEVLPTFTGSTAFSIAENGSSVGQTAVTDQSAVGDVSYTLTGIDAALFEIDATGNLGFKAAPDFESKHDVGADNIYDITVNAQDEHGKSTTENVTISVTNVNDAPKFSSTSKLEVNVTEDTASVASIAASDQDGDDITYTLTGIDAALFDIDTDGKVVFKTAPDFETAQDNGTDNIYNITINAADASTTTSRDVDVTVANYGEPIIELLQDDFLPIGDEFQVNSEEIVFLFNLSTTALKDGNFVITWDTNEGGGSGTPNAIKAQIYAADGTTIGNEFIVNDEGNYYQTDPSIIALNDGGFVISWLSYDPVATPNGEKIKLQMFNADGTTNGGKFFANDASDDIQMFPSMVTLDNGSFVIVWMAYEYTEGTETYGIKAQIYNADKTKIGVEFLIDTETETSQSVSSIAASDDGGFVITWQSFDSSYQPTDLKSQIYDEAGTAVGESIVVDDQPDNYLTNPIETELNNGGYVSILTSEEIIDGVNSTSIEAQIYQPSTETVYYNDGETHDFKINAQLHANHPTDTLGDVTISGVPDEATFNQGTNNNDASWTFSQAQLSGLQISFAADYSGIHQLTLSVISTDVNNIVRGSQVSVPIEITDINHAPEFASADPLVVSVAENQTDVATVAASDLDGDDINYTLTGDDAALFDIDTAGRVTFKTAPDFETPLDVGADNIYDITVSAVDATTTRDANITVTDIEEPILQLVPYSTSGSEFLVNSQTNRSQRDSSITTLNDGGFIITWASEDKVDDASGYGIKAQIYNEAGDTIGDEFLVNTQTYHAQIYPTISALNNGGFVIAWQSHDGVDDNSSYAIKAQIFDETGNAIGVEFLVNSQTDGSQSKPAISALSNGGFIITWYSNLDVNDTDSTSIKAQIYDKTGNEVGDEFLIENQVYDSLRPQSLTYSTPSITGLNEGGFVIDWVSEHVVGTKIYYNITAQIYDSNGNVLGDEFLVNDHLSLARTDSTVTALNQGGFVISWTSHDTVGDAHGFGVKAQIFDKEGNSIGDEFLVNSQLNFSQLNPSITALSDGGFVITWGSKDGVDDTSDYGIKAQIYDENGNAIGDEFLVNSQTNSHQRYPSITSLNDGGFVITWYSYDGVDDSSSTGIKAQIYKPIEALTYNDGETNLFNIHSSLHVNHQSDTLSDVTVSGVPDEATFNQGTDNNDGSWTFTQAQLAGLKITFDSNYSGTHQFTLSVTSTSTAGVATTTNISILMSVTNIISGTASADSKTATSGVDIVQLDDGIDTFTEAGDIGDYSFKTEGDNLQIIHTASGASNTDLLNSVELLIFNNAPATTVDVADLHDLGHITDITSAEYDTWLSQNYYYDLV